MDDEVLKDIVNYAAKRLNESYGFCGVAQGAKVALLNSTDKQGRDIRINIKVEDE